MAPLHTIIPWIIFSLVIVLITYNSFAMKGFAETGMGYEVDTTRMRVFLAMLGGTGVISTLIWGFTNNTWYYVVLIGFIANLFGVFTYSLISLATLGRIKPILDSIIAALSIFLWLVFN